MSFMFDIETLGTESTSIVLSAAIVHFTGKESTQELVDKGLMVKFKFDEQVQLGRTKDSSTVTWWSKQGEYQRKQSLYPSKNDVMAADGIEMLRDYIKKHDPDGNQFIWTRGGLDQMCIESLSNAIGVKPIAYFNLYRDVRTFITLMKDTEQNGYCKIPEGIVPEGSLIKHDPLHDCVLDIIMMVHGE